VIGQWRARYAWKAFRMQRRIYQALGCAILTLGTEQPSSLHNLRAHSAANLARPQTSLPYNLL